MEEIEELNILGATYLAMNRAIAALGVGIDLALIDGNRNAGIEYPSRCIVKGDAKCVSIAAASVLAKVTRDRYMRALAEKYPGYGFERHKGYGTEAHYAAIRALGPLPGAQAELFEEHEAMTDAERRKRARLRAAAAEAACAEYLRRKGYTVLDKNYFCRGGELDLVAELNTGGLLSKRLASLRRGLHGLRRGQVPLDGLRRAARSRRSRSGRRSA